MTELILIRHGETDWNRELRFQGQSDVPLNAAGLAQARRVAERLAGAGVRQVVSSDLLRARQTAEPLGLHAAPDAPPRFEFDAALREQHFGVAEGLRGAEIRQRDAQAWEQWTRFDADYAFAGGESARQFHVRVLAAVRALVARHAGATLAVVTHGGVLDMLYRSALGLPLSGPRCVEIPNAGINRVCCAGERIEILCWADTRHLDGLPPQPVYDQARVARPDLAGESR